MTFYIYSPNWFSGFDSIIELLIIITSFLIAFYAYKIYKYFEINRYKYFSFSFLFIGLSYIMKIISNLIFIVPIKREFNFSFYTVSYTTYEKIAIIDSISFFFHKFFLLLALMILFLIVTKEKKPETIGMILLLTIITTYLINNYLLFNFLIIIISLYLVLTDYSKKKSIKKITSLGYFFIGFSLSYFFIFLAIKGGLFYIIGEIILMITFTYLLYTFIKTFKK